jgi:hypothetical protein
MYRFSAIWMIILVNILLQDKIKLLYRFIPQVLVNWFCFILILVLSPKYYSSSRTTPTTNNTVTFFFLLSHRFETLDVFDCPSVSSTLYFHMHAELQQLFMVFQSMTSPETKDTTFWFNFSECIMVDVLFYSTESINNCKRL